MRSVLSVLSLCGCGSLSYYGDDLRALEQNDGGGDGAPGPSATLPSSEVALAITSVTPDFGSNAGGTEVTVTGTFDETAVLGFGGVEAVITERSASELTAVVPANAATGWVDVTVASGARSATAPDAFEYFADAAGLAGTFGEVAFVHQVGGYWVGGPVDSASAQFGFIEPTDWELFLNFAPTLDSCVESGVTSMPAFVDTGADLFELKAAGASVPLTPDAAAAGLFTNWQPDPATEITPGTTYDLHGTPAGGDWRVYDLPAAVTVPPPFVVTSPVLDAPAGPLVKRTTFTLQWDGSGGDYVLIWLMRREAAGAYTIVSCAAVDDGAFTVPSDTWTAWLVGDFIDVWVGRVVVSRDVLPYDNSENRVAGTYWYYGAVISN